MKEIPKFFAIVFIGVSIFISCHREYSYEGSADKNKPPIANAGPDLVITLPTDSVSLDGSSSSDPDGHISSYLWAKISGPASFNIIKSSDSITKVKILVAGIYQFELKVTDNGGLSAKDTMRIIVDSVMTNHPPIANAGTDRTIVLPTNTVNLDGSASNDPENNITSYMWTKISGPSSFNIASPNATQTQAVNLVQGIYQFELKVTDAGGLSSKDTIKITVSNIPGNCNEVPVQIINGAGSLIPFGTILPARGTSIGVAGNKMLFAGGYSGTVTNHVDIYDFSNVSWSTATLSEARAVGKVATVGNKILFAIGVYDNSFFSNVVDIYDASINSWSAASLSEVKYNGDVAIAVVDNKVLFAGGTKQTAGLSTNVSSRVDIYDASSDTWSTTELSQARSGIATAVVGTKVFFAGGWTASCCDGDDYPANPSSRIDIYDNATNTWTTAELSEARFDIAATANGNKVLFAGGYYYGSPLLFPTSNRVDIYDASTNSWSISALSEPRSNIKAVSVGNKMLFAGGVGNNNVSGKVDIYDITTGNWSSASLIQPRIINEVASIGNKILFFSGFSQTNSVYMDVYDEQSNMLSAIQLNYSLSSSAVIAASNSIYIGGGIVGNSSGFHYTCMVWQFGF